MPHASNSPRVAGRRRNRRSAFSPLRIPGRSLAPVLLVALGLVACDSIDPVPVAQADDPSPSAALVLGLTSHEGTVGETVGEEIRVRITDDGGRSVPGATVRFDAVGGGGATSPIVATTDGSGVARTRWTLGPIAGEQRVEVRLAPGRPALAAVTATARPGPPYDVAVFPGEITLPLGQGFELEARVRDEFGNGLGSHPVSWSSLDESVVLVSADGQVTGLSMGSTFVEARPLPESTDSAETSEGAAGSIGLHHRPDHAGGRSRVEVIDGDDADVVLSAVSGDGQTGVVGETLPERLEVRLVDGEGRPLRHVRVDWTVTEGTGAVSTTSTATDGQGRAGVWWTLGPLVQTNSLEARVGDLGTVAFSASAIPGPLAEVEISPEDASIEIGETMQFQAAGTDRYGNLITDHAPPEWSTTDPAVASVSSSGLATALGGGSTDLVVDIEGVEARTRIVAAAGSDPDEGGDPEGDEPPAEEEPMDDPEPVTDLNVVNTTETTAELRFTQVDDGSGGPANYEVRHTLSPIGWGWGSAEPVTQGSCSDEVMGTGVGDLLTCTVEGLEPGTRYDFQLVSYRGLISDGSRIYGPLSNVATAETRTSPGSTGPAECDDPHPAWIWCDDFELDRTSSYFEYVEADGSFTRAAGVGRDGSHGMRVRFREGQVSAGSLKLAFGRTPYSYFRPVDAGAADYQDIYWRVYVRYQDGWIGGGADKMSRVTSFVGSNWAQSMIGHVWSGRGSDIDYLVIDPASGTDADGNLRTTRYNDFSNLRWLGGTAGEEPIFNSSNVGRWFCVEARVRLNRPGYEDGVFELWIDGQLDARVSGLNWRGSYDEYGINAMFLENYWNDGAPTTQERYFDNLVVSTEPIGC